MWCPVRIWVRGKVSLPGKVSAPRQLAPLLRHPAG